MKPVKNISSRYLDVGDSWDGYRIIGLVPCTDAESCRRQYTNLERACGGYKRQVCSDGSQGICMFFTVAGGLLSSERDGRPL